MRQCWEENKQNHEGAVRIDENEVAGRLVVWGGGYFMWNIFLLPLPLFLISLSEVSYLVCTLITENAENLVCAERTEINPKQADNDGAALRMYGTASSRISIRNRVSQPITHECRKGSLPCQSQSYTRDWAEHQRRFPKCSCAT